MDANAKGLFSDSSSGQSAAMTSWEDTFTRPLIPSLQETIPFHSQCSQDSVLADSPEDALSARLAVGQQQQRYLTRH